MIDGAESYDGSGRRLNPIFAARISRPAPRRLNATKDLVGTSRSWTGDKILRDARDTGDSVE
jgi:hypothetical protein